MIENRLLRLVYLEKIIYYENLSLLSNVGSQPISTGDAGPAYLAPFQTSSLSYYLFPCFLFFCHIRFSFMYFSAKWFKHMLFVI